jgi:hypothetical protein
VSEIDREYLRWKNARYARMVASGASTDEANFPTHQEVWRAATQAATQAERKRCAGVASGYPQRCGIHPDLKYSEMNRAAQSVAHTTAEQIAAAIRETR